MVGPNSSANLATAFPGVHSRPETAGRSGQLRRSSTAVRRSGRSAALAAAAGVGCSRSARSKIATRSHRRSASSHSCWHRYPTDRHANRNDRPVGRTHSRIPDLTCMSVRDRGRVAFDMWQAIHARGYRRASKSSLWELLLNPSPSLTSAEDRQSNKTAHRKPLAVRAEAHFCVVDFPCFRIEYRPSVVVHSRLFHPLNEKQPEERLVMLVAWTILANWVRVVPRI